MGVADSETINELEHAGVLRDSSGVVELTEEFAERSRAHVEAADPTGAEAGLVARYADLGDEPPWLRRSAEGYAAALAEFDVSLPERELVAVALSLARLEEEPPERESNTPFFRLEGDEVEGYVEANNRALLLVTRPDCEPCDRIRANVRQLVEEGDLPADLPLAEVSGPENRYFLLEEYDVVGAPTLLFCEDGAVEMRLVGNNHIKQLRRDVARVYPDLA